MVLALLIIPPDDTSEYRTANVDPIMSSFRQRLSEEITRVDDHLLSRRGMMRPTGEIVWREVWANTFGFSFPGQEVDERGFVSEGVFLLRNAYRLAKWNTDYNHVESIGPLRSAGNVHWAEQSNHTEPLETAQAYWQAFSRRLFADERTIVTSGSSLRAETRTWIITGHYVKDGEIVRYADGKAVGFRAEINGIETLLEQAKFGPLDL